MMCPSPRSTYVLPPRMSPKMTPANKHATISQLANTVTRSVFYAAVAVGGEAVRFEVGDLDIVAARPVLLNT
jgi:hypothetical protein